MGLKAVIKHLQGRHDQSSHGRGGGNYGSASWEGRGADLGEVYHGSGKKIKKLDPSRLQSRDSGYYGEGFYVTANPEYAKSYGRSITKVQLNPNAKVLNASALRPQEADPKLVKAVQDSYYNRGLTLAKQYGREERFKKHIGDEIGNIATSPISWKEALRGYGVAEGYDIIKYSDGEIVVRNLDVVTSLKEI